MEEQGTSACGEAELRRVEDAPVEPTLSDDEDDQPEHGRNDHRRPDVELESDRQEAGLGEAGRSTAVDLDLDELERDRDRAEVRNVHGRAETACQVDTAVTAIVAVAAEATSEIRTFGSLRASRWGSSAAPIVTPCP